MNIIFDYQIFSLQKFGGISRYFVELANGLANIEDVNISFFSPIFVNDYIDSTSSRPKVLGRKFPVFRRSGFVYLMLNRVWVSLLPRRARVDIVHETYYSSKSTLRVSGKRILTVFDMIHERFPDGVATWDATVRNKSAAVKRADHIICISENTRRDLIDFLKVDPEKITVIHLGFSLTGNKSNIEFSTRRPYILFVGNRGGYKNFETLLQVYAQCTFLNSKYDLIAFGGGCLSSTERIRIETLGLSVDQVRDIQGGDELLAAAYKKAALFVFPSFYEGFGIPPLEAMGFRCPVACSNQSSMPEVVGDAAILFDPYSIDSMREALELILSNDALRAEYVSKGIERIRNFSWDKCAAETMAVYEKVLK